MKEMGTKDGEAGRRLSLVRDESGAVAVAFAITLTALCGFVALALDIGHMVSVRAELQRTADAAALAGAMSLAPYTGTWSNPTPNWLQGYLQARNLIYNADNKADNLRFGYFDGSVDLGYWYLNAPSGYTQPISNTTRPTTAAYMPEPAVTVTLSRQVALSFAPIIGVSSPQTVNARATAILPETYSAYNIPPIAVAEDTVYDFINDNVVMDISEQDIKIQSNKEKAGWFNLDGGNSVPSVLYSEPLTASTTQVYLAPGTKATLTDLISVGQTIILPVVETVEEKVWRTITGFVGFKVDSLDANSMTGHFVNKFFSPFVNPAPYNASNSPVWGTPKLVK